MKKIEYSIPGWMDSNLKIVDMDGRVSPLSLNVGQQMLHRTIEEIQVANGYPVRIIILKARRQGMSTYTEGRFFREINHRSHVNAVVASADIASTNKVFKMAKMFQKNMPNGIRRETDYSNRKEIVYSEPHGSAFIAQTAGTEVLGRGGQNHYFHPTEFAFWKDAKTQFGGAMQEVPDNDSMVIIESCVTGDTLVFTDKGIRPIIELMPNTKNRGHSPIFTNIHGRGGVQLANSAYVNGWSYTKKIKTRYGFGLEATRIHPVLVLEGVDLVWKKAEDVSVGDFLCISHGQELFNRDWSLDFELKSKVGTTGNKERFCPKEWTADIAYLVGLYISEGYASTHPVRTVITSGDEEIHSFLKKQGFARKDKHHSWLFKKDFIDFMGYIGCDIKHRAWEKHIPSKILTAPKTIQEAFLSGLFDGDGSIHRNRRMINYATTSPYLAKELQVMLLNFGIVSRMYKQDRVGKKGGVIDGRQIICKHDAYYLEITRDGYDIFLDEIGFRLERKLEKRINCKGRGYLIPNVWSFIRKNVKGYGVKAKLFRDAGFKKHQSRCYSDSPIENWKLESLIDAGLKVDREILDYFYDPVVSIEDGLAETFDLTVPNTHSFVTNGIMSHNTANGIGGAFHDMYWEAKEDWKFSKSPGNFLPIFFPWFVFPEYQRKIPDSTNFIVGRPHASNIPSEWVAVEEELMSKHGLTENQLFWRRWAIKNKCQNDLNLFDQEYPWCDIVAFNATGRNVFLQSKVESLECSDGRTALLVKRGDRIQPESVDQQRNCWQIWKKPQAGHCYAIGIDTMEGTQSDPDDAKSNYDYHAMSVLDRDTGEIVAIYLGRGSQNDLGHQGVLAAKWYNSAWIAPELPMGMVVLDVLRESGYDRIYQRQKDDEQRIESDSLNLGWRTTIITRPKMIDNFKTAFNEGDLKIYSKDLKDEMQTFVYDKKGTPRHRPGKHDDLLFASMIALQLHLRLPFHSSPYHAATTDGDEDFEQEEETDLAMRGAVDTWEAGDEEEFDMYTE